MNSFAKSGWAKRALVLALRVVNLSGPSGAGMKLAY